MTKKEYGETILRLSRAAARNVARKWPACDLDEVAAQIGEKLVALGPAGLRELQDPVAWATTVGNRIMLDADRRRKTTRIKAGAADAALARKAAPATPAEARNRGETRERRLTLLRSKEGHKALLKRARGVAREAERCAKSLERGESLDDAMLLWVDDCFRGRSARPKRSQWLHFLACLNSHARIANEVGAEANAERARVVLKYFAAEHPECAKELAKEKMLVVDAVAGWRRAWRTKNGKRNWSPIRQAISKFESRVPSNKELNDAWREIARNDRTAPLAKK